MRAYVSYVIQSLGNLEEHQPGSLKAQRGLLLKAWLPLKQYAPDLTADFMLLEQRSRGPNDNSSLPTMESLENKDQGNLGNRIKDALESGRPSVAIDRAISSSDFSTAHKLIEKLSDGPQKNRLIELMNTKEALYFLQKGNLMEARQLAERLMRATSIVEVYPLLISKCVSKKDQICATSLMLQAMKQIKNSDTAPPTLPAGLPTSILPTSRERDPILDGMAKLTLAILPLNEEMAILGLDETVAAANVSSVDTGQGRVGFDASIFKKLAPKNEVRVQQAAESFKDPVRRIVSLAAIYQWKAESLDKRATTAKSMKKN
jgi:hypothetical protein